MFEQPGCPYCHAWNVEVGSAYARTDEAKLLPLRRVELNETRPRDLIEISGVRFTPTFIVMHCGHEIDRIVGYSGSEAFWMQMVTDLKLLTSEPVCRSTRHAERNLQLFKFAPPGVELRRINALPAQISTDRAGRACIDRA